MDEESIFAAALKHSAGAARAAFLDGACLDNQELKGRVEGLLHSHEQAGTFLNEPAAPAATIHHATGERAGTLIGPYKLLEQIGEGGMGLVYMAEQQQPVRRLVALKLVKPGMDTKQVIARFEAERQALAMMDHPNIAKVHDAGTTDTGRPYFVMELVRGVPIDEFCDQQKLTVRQRLELFIQVCQAIQHAHQKGIIHRDLKPTNVLVTMNDVLAVPKVIDFGIVKAVGQSLTEHTLHTGFAQLVGTPLYMSPEQAQMNQLGVDTRSDVYSLGVLLYELLTGQPPFDKQRMKSAGFDEMRRIIREEEPPRPSHRISTLGAQASSTISQQRGTVKVWDAETGNELLSLQGGGGSVAYSPDGKRLASRTGRGRAEEVTVWDAQTGQEIPSLNERSDGQVLFAFSPDGKRLAIAGERSGTPRIKVSDTATGRELFTFQRHTREVTGLAFSPDSKFLASSSRDRTIRVWDFDIGQEVRSLKWDTVRISAVAFSPDGKRLASSDSVGRVKVWDLQIETQPRRFPVGPVAISSDFTRFAGFAADQMLKIVDAQTGRELVSLTGHRGVPDQITFSADGQRLAATNLDEPRELKVWDTQTGKLLHSLELKGRGVTRLAFSQDGRLLAAGWPGGFPGGGMLFDVGTGKELCSYSPGGRSGPYTAMAFSPDGKRLASGHKVFDTQTGKPLLSLDAGGAGVAFSLDGQRLAFGSLDGTIRVYDAQTGRGLLTFQGGQGYVYGVAFSPDGQRLVSASADRSVKMWDAQTGQELLVLRARPGPGGRTYASWEDHNVIFRPDGGQLASVFSDGTVTLWDATPRPDELQAKE